jgi:hypothetical protein
MTAADRFNIALITTASQGLRPHCDRGLVHASTAGSTIQNKSRE